MAASAIGRKVRKCGSHAAGEKLIEYALFKKRTATLVARLSPFAAWFEWAGRTQAKWPPEENELLVHLEEQIKFGCAATRPKRLLESLRFIHFVLGFRLVEVVESQVLAGIALKHESKLGLRKQAVVIPAWVVEHMEIFAERGALPLEEAVVNGGLLLMLCTRARGSDLKAAFNVNYRAGNTITVEVPETKTSGVGDRLPQVLSGCLDLVHGVEWFASWMRLRSDQGIPWPEWPIFPARLKSGWSRFSAKLGDVNQVMRLILASKSSR